MIYVGVDFSLTSTGVCVIDGMSADSCTIGSAKEADWRAFPARVRSLIERALDWASEGRSGDLAVMIESPAYGAKGAALDRMFGGWWLAVDELEQQVGELLKATPGQLKKFATGSGSANKDAVMLATARRYPELDFTKNDEADAINLAMMCAAAYGEPYSVLTKYQKDTVDALRADGKDN